MLFWLFVSLVILAMHSLFARYFHQDQVLTFALILGLGGFCVGHLTRGTLSSHHRFAQLRAVLQR